MKEPTNRRALLLAAAALGMLLLWPAVLVAQSDDSTRQKDATAQDAGQKDQQSEDRGFLRQMRFAFEVGGLGRSLSGEKPSKLEEYKDIPEGLSLRHFKFTGNPAADPRYFRLLGRDAGQRDQQYLLEAGSYESHRTWITWSGFPRLYSYNAKSLFNSSGLGVFTIPDLVQQGLQNTPDPFLPAAVRRLVAEASSSTLRTQRQTLDAEERVNLTDRWSVRIRWLDNRRFGQRPLGTGSYERIDTPIGNMFRVLSIELPSTVQQRMDQVTLGTGYVASRWAVNLDYTFSWFDNRVRSITFDNPFQFTDQQATAGGTVGRMRFSRGIYALEPDNTAQNLLLSGYFNLTDNTRWASALGWGFWRQDEPFVPFTLNTAITATGLPPGTTVTQVEALPRRSLDGKVDTFTQDHLLSSRLTDNISFNLHYRYYDYDDETPSIRFPGYAAAGESFWLTTIANQPIENQPFSYLKQNASAELMWNISKSLNWNLEYQWEGWNRRFRQAPRTNEHRIGTMISARPNDRIYGKLSYRYSDRTPTRYDPGVKEFSRLRMFDQSKRLRHDAQLQFQMRLTPALGMSGTLAYLSDDYDQNFFGLVKYISGSGNVDFLYNPAENTTVYASYSRERIASQLQSIAKTLVPFDIRNRWDRLTRDVVDSFGIGVSTFMMQDRLSIDAHYALSAARERIDTANPFTPRPEDLLNALAFPWPKINSRFHELNSEVSYQLRDNVGIGVRYIYEPYRLNDFAWDILSPYPFDRLAPENDGRRFLLLDSRYSSHDAHIFGAYIRFSFGKAEQK